MEHNITTMVATSFSPSKPSSDERLARKREAARIRQQRCRARKRQALVERRLEKDQHFPAVHRRGDARLKTKDDSTKSSPFRLTDLTSSPPRQPIYKTVSFDSPRSPQELKSILRPVSLQVISRCSSAESSLSSASSPERSSEDDTNQFRAQEKDSLVQEEEAAIAAMLSLKSADSPKGYHKPGESSKCTRADNTIPDVTVKQSVNADDDRPVLSVKAKSNDSKYVYYGEWEHYQPRYAYSRYPHYPPAPYYAMPARVTAAPQYRYEAYGKTYSRYGYA